MANSALLNELWLYRSGILAIAIVFTTHSGEAQISRQVNADSIHASEARLRIIYASDEKRLPKRFMNNYRKKHFIRAKIRCADGFSRDDSKYLLFHTNIAYPSTKDDLEIWNVAFKVIEKIPNSRFLRSGWFAFNNQQYFFLGRSYTVDTREIVNHFTFFELDGKLAIIFYECGRIEMLDQFPIRVAFAHRGNELLVPIFQRY